MSIGSCNTKRRHREVNSLTPLCVPAHLRSGLALPRKQVGVCHEAPLFALALAGVQEPTACLLTLDLSYNALGDAAGVALAAASACRDDARCVCPVDSPPFGAATGALRYHPTAQVADAVLVVVNCCAIRQRRAQQPP